MTITTIFLRKEIYENEYRCPLVPNDINILCNYGFTIFVQSSETRCFTNYEFEKAGAIITDKSWDNFSNCLIIGIKELDNIDKLNSHTHVYFSHSYKNQNGANILLQYFKKSNSYLYDLEYFVNEQNKRLIAFGYYAGFIGAGLGLLQYLKKTNGNKLSNLKYWNSSQEIIDNINNYKIPDKISICIIGSTGRCGKGAQALFNTLGINFIELSSQDPKTNLESYDIVVNCICLSKPVGIWYDYTTPFYKNTVIADISCDYTSLNNPIKLYNNRTTWEEPIFSYNKLVDIIAIDNLPSLLPSESSAEFSSILTDLLLQYNCDLNGYWANNLETFKNKINFIL
jgi:saccharopine dehydrogenase (NAD+, L-lysine-forming)